MPTVFAGIGIILTAYKEDYNRGFEFGNLGIAIAEKLNAFEQKPKAIQSFNLLIRHWKNHMKDSIDEYLKGYFLSLEVGDLECAAICLNSYDIYNFHTGKNLEKLRLEMEQNNKIIENLHQSFILDIHSVRLQTVLNLLNYSNDPSRLKGTAFKRRRLPENLGQSK